MYIVIVNDIIVKKFSELENSCTLILDNKEYQLNETQIKHLKAHPN